VRSPRPSAREDQSCRSATHWHLCQAVVRDRPLTAESGYTRPSALGRAIANGRFQARRSDEGKPAVGPIAEGQKRARKQPVRYIGQQTYKIATTTVREQTQAMTESARAIIDKGSGAAVAPVRRGLEGSRRSSKPSVGGLADSWSDRRCFGSQLGLVRPPFFGK
jgi:hypothetical protein